MMDGDVVCYGAASFMTRRVPTLIGVWNKGE
jgi:hypothetical protein